MPLPPQALSPVAHAPFQPRALQDTVPAPPAASARVTFAAIDVLRAAAALMVLVFHVIILGKWEAFSPYGAWIVLRNGWVGVDLFFIISGFVISLAALQGYETHGPAFRRTFARHRLARIVPLYLLSGMVYLFCTQPELLAASPQQWGVRIAAFALFVQNLHPDWHGSINGPSWSVALEMQFYLLMLCVAPWLARTRAAWVVAVAVILAASYRLVSTLVLVPGDAVIHTQFIYLSQLPGVVDEFALGMVLAVAVRRRQGRLARALAPSWFNFFAWTAVAAALLSVAGMLFARWGYWESRAMLVLWRPLLSLGLCALVACAIAFPRPGTAWLAPARYLGTVSYGLYLWHYPVLLTLTLRAPSITGASLLLWTLCGTLLLSVFSWHLIEKPCIDRLRNAPPPRAA